MNEDSIVVSPEIYSTDNYPTPEIAEDWSDSDSSSDEDDSPHISFFSRDCILKLKIDVDERSLEPVYQLSAVPYVSKNNPLTKLKENNWCIGDQQAVYDHFQISGKDEILSQFKSLLNRTPLDIGDTRYCLSFHAVISGALGKHLLPVSYYSREYSKEQFRLFISVADLLMRNVSLEDNAINEAFEYQQQAYDLFLLAEEKKEIINKLNYHPARARKKHLNTIKAQWSVSESPQIGYSNPALDYLHTFGSWLSDQLVRFTQATSYVAPQTEALEGERLNVIARLRANQYDSLTAQKNDLKRLIELRSSYKPDAGFYARLVHTSRLSREFWHSISKPECWENPEIIEKARQLVLENIILSDEILADMEYFIRDAGFEPTPLHVAALLDNQNLPFGRTFIYSGIVDFYAYFREKGWSGVIGGLLINGKPARGFKFAEPAQTNSLFFNKNTQEYKLRKLYNTFIKYGFYQKYGEEEEGADFRRTLSVADNRYVNWTSIDKKINKPCPETWPQFFKRNILGGEQPTEESYTYSHPVYDTRPT
ncbi:hypothetical protein B1207_02335 [Legionella quinlivanii]|uniref:Uncharacterized protein n=1 Tax=Legionella quinlivanii TaxID=45073 RepID=A0A364LLV1_9GAMM|nr:hypothetical protein [Legionella quinlivanii]RAP37849.1 hypothetical protein B1207_02335 [Legionella quinlivanii]